jgi:hypothetical protein
LDPALRIVIRLPLEELWNEKECLVATRRADLASVDIVERLRGGPLRFVVADCGHPLRWIPEDECFGFWKTELKRRLADPGVDIDLDEFLGGYCYLASEWDLDSGGTVVLLEMFH